jgi:hypothetical protein
LTPGGRIEKTAEFVAVAADHLAGYGNPLGISLALEKLPAIPENILLSDDCELTE